MSRRKRNGNQLEFWATAPCPPTLLSRATARRSKHVEAPAPKPWRCVVLAVDAARRSGWAISVCGHLQESGELDTLDEALIERIVLNALEYVERVELPLVLVLESPWGGSVAVVSALGAARERWLRAWRKAGQAMTRVVPVTASTWRGPVLGAEWVSAPRDVVRAHERRVAQVIAAANVARRALPVGDDEAPAILIARWASHAARVGRAIGKRAAKASLRAWTTGAS